MLELQELRHSQSAFGLGDRTLAEDDVRAGRHRVRPLHVETGLESLAHHVGVVLVEWGDGANRSQYLERRRIRETVSLVKPVEILDDGWTAKRIDDDNCLAGSVVAGVQDRIQLIGMNLRSSCPGPANRRPGVQRRLTRSAIIGSRPSLSRPPR